MTNINLALGLDIRSVQSLRSSAFLASSAVNRGRQNSPPRRQERRGGAEKNHQTKPVPAIFCFPLPEAVLTALFFCSWLPSRRPSLRPHLSTSDRRRCPTKALPIHHVRKRPPTSKPSRPPDS